MNYTELVSMVNEDVLTNIIYHKKYPVNYFYKFRDQRSVTTIDVDKIFTSQDVIDSFNGFSLGFGDGFLNVKNYIVFINPKKDPIEEYRSNCMMYLPRNKYATHVCIDSDDVEEVEELFGMLLKSYPSLELVQRTSVFNPSNNLIQNMRNQMGNSPIFELYSYCDSLLPLSITGSPDYIYKFESCVTEIMEKGKGKFLIYGGDYLSLSYEVFKNLVSEIYLRDSSYRFNVDVDHSISVGSMISSNLFNPQYMLVEDVAKFLLNLPNIVAESRSPFIMYNLVKTRTLTSNCMFAPLGKLKESEVKINSINLNNVTIMPLNKYYNLESSDYESNISAERELRSFIHSLYSIFKVPKDDYLNITNVFFFIMDGVEYVGYNIKYNFKATCHSLMANLGISNRSLTIDDVKGLIYLEPYLEAWKILHAFQKMGIINRTSITDVRPVKTFRTGSVSFMNYKISNNFTDWADCNNSLFLIGMYSQSCYAFRTSLYRTISREIGVDKLRSLLDSFGGFNLVNNNSIHLSMSR